MTTETPAGPEAPASSPAPAGSPSPYGPRQRRSLRSGRRRQLRNRGLRILLLLILVAGVGSLTAIFLQGRQDRAGAVQEEADAEEGTAVAGVVEEEVGETLQLRAEEFESTLEREGVEIFRIRGAQTSSDDRGNVILKQVEVDYPSGEDHYSLRADGASYNEDTRATRLEGSVALEGTNGLELDTDWLELADGGLVLTAADDSRFSFEGMTARGDALRMDFREEVVRLGGGVRIDGAEPQDSEEGDVAAAPQSLSLAAETLVYEWGDGVVSFSGGAEMRAGEFVLSSRSLTLRLNEAETLGSLEARGEIEMQAPLRAAGGTLEPGADPASEPLILLRGEALDVGFDDAQLPGRFVLSGPDWGGPAVLRLDETDGSIRRIRARLIAFTFEQGVPTDFESRGRVELAEFVPGRPRPVREARSITAAGSFDAGGVLVELAFGGNVEVTDRRGAELLAQADEATIEVAAERVDLRGQPAKLVHPEGELEGAVVIFDGSSRCSEASGGIRFVIRGAEVAAEGVLPLAGGGPEPSVVTAGEAMLCDQAPSHFRGDVELRRGPDLVRAAQLRVSEGLRQLVATGNVRTIWHAAQGPGTDAPEEQTPEAAPERWEPERWEIRAERLNYSEDDAELRYTGSAHALLGEQSLECAELTVTTTPPESNASTGELEAGTLYCLGNAVLDDAGFGRSVAADRAVYGFRDRVMSLSGNVVLRQGSDELRGPRLIYWLDESRYEIGESAALPAGVGEP